MRFQVLKGAEKVILCLQVLLAVWCHSRRVRDVHVRVCARAHSMWRAATCVLQLSNKNLRLLIRPVDLIL